MSAPRLTLSKLGPGNSPGKVKAASIMTTTSSTKYPLVYEILDASIINRLRLKEWKE